MKCKALVSILVLFIVNEASSKPVKLQCFYYDSVKQNMTFDPFSGQVFVVDGDARTVLRNGTPLASEWSEDRLIIEEPDVANTDSNVTGKLYTKISRYSGDLTQSPTRYNRAGTQLKLERSDIRLGKCAEQKTIF